MIQETLLTILLDDSYVTNVVGQRIYPLRMPQNASLPAVVYQRIGVDPVSSLSGDSYLDRARIQITCWALSYSAAVNLANKIRQSINRSEDIKSITVFEMDTEDPETKSYGVISDYLIWNTVEELPQLDFEYLLMESGDFLLLETGDKLALEV